MYKILIIEDDTTMQTTLSEVLRREGFEALQAFDGMKGIELAKENNPDLIFLDIIIPEKNGFEVLQVIKADENLKRTKIVMLTNLEGSSDIDKALELGATSYVVKANTDLDYIVAMVKNLLNIDESRKSTT